MADITLVCRLQCRTDTAANWTSQNPVLLQGELGYESDTKKSKLGDGSTVWANLSYLPTSSFVLPAGGQAGQALVSDGQGGCQWGWIAAGNTYIPT